MLVPPDPGWFLAVNLIGAHLRGVCVFACNSSRCPEEDSGVWKLRWFLSMFRSPFTVLNGDLCHDCTQAFIKKPRPEQEDMRCQSQVV